jgi:hypothetical protein
MHDLQDFYGNIDEKPPVSFELVNGGKVFPSSLEMIFCIADIRQKFFIFFS